MTNEAAGHKDQHRGGQSGEPVRDPVCGMNVDPKSTAHQDSFGGQNYFFCSQHCLVKFRGEPTRYLAPPVRGMFFEKTRILQVGSIAADTQSPSHQH